MKYGEHHFVYTSFSQLINTASFPPALEQNFFVVDTRGSPWLVFRGDAT